MVSKVAPSGQNISGLLNYLYEGKEENRKANDKDCKVVMSSNDLFIPNDHNDKSTRKELADQFIQQSKNYLNHKEDLKYIGHHIISFSHLESKHLTDEQKNYMTNKYIELMNIDKSQYIVFSHSDREHAHNHIVFNRVMNNNKMFNSHYEKQRSACASVAILLSNDMKLEHRQKILATNKTTIDFYSTFDNISQLRVNMPETLGTARNPLHLEKLCEKQNIPFTIGRFNNGDNYYSVDKKEFKETDILACCSANRKESTINNMVQIADSIKQDNSPGKSFNFDSSISIDSNFKIDFGLSQSTRAGNDSDSGGSPKKRINGLKRKKDNLNKSNKVSVKQNSKSLKI